MGKWVLTQLDPIKLNLIGLLIGNQKKAQTQKKIKKKAQKRKKKKNK